MNPFVDFNKRNIQLPKGCSDLAELLKAKRCLYCDEIAVPTRGWPDDVRWCELCQNDLMDFARQEDFSVLSKLNDNAALEAYRADQTRREDEFMRERIKQRKPE